MTSQYVWEVRAKGGDPQEIAPAIERGIERLRSGDGGTLDPDEVTVWREDVSWHKVSEVAVAGNDRSALVDIGMFRSDPALAATLSGGFDEVILDEVISVAGVHHASHSDRIPRAETEH